MEINRNNVFEIIDKAGLKADKDYGQNYLVEPSISEAIVDCLEVNENDDVLEIGPGLGSLTNFVKNYKSFTVVDIDRRMVDFLEVIYQNENIQIVNDDIRKHNVSNYSKILGNLPYNITTELVTYLLINAKKVEKMTLMCQFEAYTRFSDLKGENYGPVSILLHSLGEVKRNLTVKAGSFTPVPKINSTVFTFTRDNNKDFETAFGVYKLSKQLFLNRRKTILNNLKNVLQNKERSENILKECNISPLSRPEDITVEQYHMMYRLISKI